MTPLDFFISVKNSEAMDGMAEVPNSCRSMAAALTD